ncbi:hypothetical protein FACS1894202_09950 [Clostridia bacterium]|nr:hypothetical protein FACS1894202_09950 [Clostridia bacterium]
MDFRTCRTCGKIFAYKGGGHQCPDCIKEEDRKFVLVRNYMFENPTAGLDDLCEACDVSDDTVTRWLREGRLIAREGAPLLKCSKCGTPIAGGMYCQKCSDVFAAQMGGAAADMRRSIEKANERVSGPRGVGAQEIRRK